jgi:hypothetical protein
MLLNRMRSIDCEGTMYHYCSGDTFLNIVRSRAIRFSDIHLLNDKEEGQWGYHILLSAIKRIRAREGIPNLLPVVPEQFLADVLTAFLSFNLGLSSFVACFSTDGDSLSQWRAYADDGRGFAIGFDARLLRRLPIQILDVLYDEEEQIREMIIAVGAMYMESEHHEAEYTRDRFLNQCHLLAATSIALKNPAWRDEKEVRCHHVVTVDITTDVWTIQSAGGSSEGEAVPPLPVQFQVRGGTVVPYFDMPFEVSEKSQPIVEIALGPKCPNSPGNIKLLLGNHGYGPIPLRSALAAYR